MRMAGSQTVLIYSVDKEKRDIMRWLIEEKHADVNQAANNGETPLQRAIFRNNEPILRDLLSYGANMEYLIPNMNMSLPIYAVMRGSSEMLDVMLEKGASMDYRINGKPVDDTLKKKEPAIAKVHLKHERWRRLRKFLKLEE